MKSFEKKTNTSKKKDAQPLYGGQNECYRQVNLIAIMCGFSCTITATATHITFGICVLSDICNILCYFVISMSFNIVILRCVCVCL